MIRNKTGILASLVLTSALVLAGCANNSATTGSDTKAPDGGDKAKAASATSLKDFGTMADLEAAAKAEGALNVIALPHNWSNYGEVIAAFKTKYPEISVNEANPNASSKEEVDAIKTNQGTDKAPDVLDLGIGVAAASSDLFAPYQVQSWDDIPGELKESSGLYYADYTGIMSMGWNKSKFGDITSLDQLTDPKFKGTVALNGKPAEAGSAFNGFLMINLANKGDINNLQPGLDFFTKLKEAGTLTTIDVTDATIDSGQTGVVFDWSYNMASHKERLAKQGIDWEYKVFPGSEIASYYNQAINKDAPHPAAARLWQEFLYSPEAQNLWLKGGSMPVLLEKMKTDGTVDQSALANQIQTSKAPLTYTVADSDRITAWLKDNWDKTIGN